MQTAELLLFLDKLFDSVNSANLLADKPLRSALTASSVHWEFWKEAIKVLNSMTYYDSEKKKFKRPVCLNNWVNTINGIRYLWGSLNRRDFKYLNLRNLNQDCLENFFSSIRAHGYRNVSPSIQSFIGSYKTLLLNNLLSPHSAGANCEADSLPLLANIKYLLQTTTQESPSTSAADSTASSLPSDTSDIITVSTLLHKQTSAYVAGWVAHKILINNNCDCCKQYLVTDNQTVIHELVSIRQFCNNKKNLKYASNGLVGTFNVIKNLFHKNISAICHLNNIFEKFLNILTPNIFFLWFKCEEHKDIVFNSIIKISLNLLIHNWCKQINRKLKGSDPINKFSDKIQKMAACKYLKRKKLYCKK